MTTQRKADLLLVLITGFWGCSYYLSDLALGEMPPFALCAVRFLLAFALLGIVLNLVLPGRSADAGAEEAPPAPREGYDDLARDFERAENVSNEKGQA